MIDYAEANLKKEVLFSNEYQLTAIYFVIERKRLNLE